MNDQRTQARRRATDAVLAELRRRKRRRHAAGAAAFALLASAVAFSAWQANQPILPRAPVVQKTAPSELKIATIECFNNPVVRTLDGPAPEIKILTSSEPPRIDLIGDRELLDALAAAGHPSGLARIDGRTFLVPQDAAGSLN